jgi:hypothetical protein
MNSFGFKLIIVGLVVSIVVLSFHVHFLDRKRQKTFIHDTTDTSLIDQDAEKLHYLWNNVTLGYSLPSAGKAKHGNDKRTYGDKFTVTWNNTTGYLTLHYPTSYDGEDVGDLVGFRVPSLFSNTVPGTTTSFMTTDFGVNSSTNFILNACISSIKTEFSFVTILYLTTGTKENRNEVIIILPPPEVITGPKPEKVETLEKTSNLIHEILSATGKPIGNDSVFKKTNESNILELLENGILCSIPVKNSDTFLNAFAFTNDDESSNRIYNINQLYIYVMTTITDQGNGMFTSAVLILTTIGDQFKFGNGILMSVTDSDGQVSGFDIENITFKI